MDDDGEPLGRSEWQPRHIRQACLYDGETNQASHDPILQRVVGSFLHHELERRMALLHLQHGIGNTID